MPQNRVRSFKWLFSGPFLKSPAFVIGLYSSFQDFKHCSKHLTKFFVGLAVNCSIEQSLDFVVHHGRPPCTVEFTAFIIPHLILKYLSILCKNVKNQAKTYIISALPQ